MPFSELSAALRAATTNISVFFRDDDAGWADDRLCTLLDLFESERAPIDLAVIPQALSRELALDLCVRRALAPERLGLHQHGYAHSNHEIEGRKCEFGPARSAKQQARDVAAGQARLRALLGQIDPFFTPPWNRCSQATIEALRSSGLQVLSRDAGAAPLELGALRECAVHVDWCKWTKLPTPDWTQLDRALASAVQSAAIERDSVGVMLHHAVMGEDDWQALRQVFALLHQYPRVRFSLMRDLPSIERRRAALPAAAHP